MAEYFKDEAIKSYILNEFNEDIRSHAVIIIRDISGDFIYFNDQHNVIIPKSVNAKGWVTELNTKHKHLVKSVVVPFINELMQEPEKIIEQENLSIPISEKKSVTGDFYARAINIPYNGESLSCFMWTLDSSNFFYHNEKPLLLSSREALILPYLLFGITMRDMSVLVDITESAIKSYIARIKHKFRASSHKELIGILVKNKAYVLYARKILKEKL